MAPRSENRSGSHQGDGFRRGETDRSTFSDASRCSTPSARLIPAADPEGTRVLTPARQEAGNRFLSLKAAGELHQAERQPLDLQVARQVLGVVEIPRCCLEKLIVHR